jgi:hypothetical protein
MPRKNDLMTFDEAKGRLMEALFDHVGKEHAVGADVLHAEVFGEKVPHKINDTKPLRKLVTAIRRQGKAIASTCSSNGGGYYIPRAGSELEDYLAHMLHRPALRKLALEAKIRKVSLPELIGQMSLNFEAQGAGLEAQGEE